ncbi:hypothetical protein Val02_80560 [Virgisporangium aliadipatigenens]|uniref:DUF4383 domain-containing protein n=1 Tax=Virgisporangium aliadipatigenens TaxID=741659 RepID=A0A8J3YWP7_9ACTN|nr:DUF4383 domain-containing protein [Virgisporangium aliadipatigenens]GIJ51170.1 hypothetical protein Val02_80560 [Virgisporangium aliadipatigenens]
MFLAHIPVNHHLRPVYRVLSGIAALYLLVFGIIGVVQASGLDLYAREDLPTVLGQQVNPAYAGLSLVFGVISLVATVIGRNLDHYVNHWVGLVLLGIGLAMLALMRTDANILGFEMTNVIVIFVIGSLLSTAGLYTKVGPTATAAAH